MPAVKTQLPPETYEALEKRARRNGRTVEEQIAAEVASAVSLEDYRGIFEDIQQQVLELGLSLHDQLSQPDLEPESRSEIEKIEKANQAMREVTSDVLALLSREASRFERRLRQAGQANAERLESRRRLLDRLHRHAPPGRRPFNAAPPEDLVREDRHR